MGRGAYKLGVGVTVLGVDYIWARFERPLGRDIVYRGASTPGLECGGPLYLFFFIRVV